MTWLTPLLLLSEPVRFVKKLEDTSFHLGNPLSLTCTYTGSQRVYVSWMKDGKPIWASYKYNVKTTDSSCVLEVLNSDREEAAGIYSCQVSNAEGSAICDAHVFCRTAKKGITSMTHNSILTCHSLTLHYLQIYSYCEQKFHPTPRLASVPLACTIWLSKRIFSIGFWKRDFLVHIQNLWVKKKHWVVGKCVHTFGLHSPCVP